MNAGVETPTAAAPQSRIAKLPVAFFGAVLGVVGLGLAWRGAVHVFGAPAWIGSVITALGVITFLLLATFYLVKIIRAPAAVLAELLHPGQSSFFGTVTISVTLLAAAALPWSRPLAEGFWAAGEALQALLIVFVVRNWIARPMAFDDIHPGWFILMVGIVVGVPTGAAIGQIELSWASLALGTLSAVTLYPIVLFRLFFHQPLPPPIRPTLFILIAPPALLFSAYYSLNGEQLDAFAHGLFFAGLFFTAVVLSLPQLFVGLPVAVSWWAYTFPLDAMTVASLAYHEKIGNAASGAVALALLALTTAIVAVVAVRTLLALARGELLGR